MGLIREEHREALSASSLELPALRRMLTEIVDDLGNSTEHPYHAIPTVTSFYIHTFPLFAYRSLSRNLQVAYGLSKMGVNLYTQMLARQHTTLCVNVCSPGFTNTGMCANYTDSHKPKDIPLGASVFVKVNLSLSFSL